jgi:hypothetical protein
LRRTRAERIEFAIQKLNKSGGGKVERLVNTIMKKILFTLSMLAFAASAVPQARGADVSIDFIYDNLSGGNWIDVEGYGYGWQPDLAVSDPNWRPYSDGYWAYTDYGWTWISYEDFGWATYHYGRWANLADHGWVWFPGEDLDWGPAWVSWRTGGDYIGWAPLPPRGPGVVYEGQPIGANVDVVFDIGPQYYNFCDVRFIGEPVLRDRIFPPVQNVTYITNTVNVTNITVQNNIVYNYGPDFAVVNKYSSRPIQRLTIERQAPINLTTAVKSGTLTKVHGNRLLVAAPQKLAVAVPTAKPPAVKAKVAQPKIEHGWKGVSNKAELEQKIKTENPKNVPPPTRAAAREVRSPAPASSSGAERGVAATTGPRGRAGRVAPGGTAAPSLGEPPSRIEPGKRRAVVGPRPGTTAIPGEGAERMSPSPFERGTVRGKQGERSAEPGGAGGPAEAARAIPRARFEGAPSRQQEQRSQPARRPGEEANPAQGGEGQIPQQGRERGLGRQRFGTPPPMGAVEHGQPRGGAPSESRQQVTHPAGGERADEARAQQERMQGDHAQPQPPEHQRQQQQQQQRGGASASGDHGQRQGQPEGGKKRAPKETPPPGPR